MCIAGNLSFHKLQSKLTSARFLAYHIPSENTGHSFLEYDVMTRERYTFMASSETQVLHKNVSRSQFGRVCAVQGNVKKYWVSMVGYLFPN